MYALITSALLLAACSGGAAQPAQPAPSQQQATRPAASPTAAQPAALPTAAAAPSPATASESAATPPAASVAADVDEGVTAEGYHFLGRADAPNTIVMYSDVF
jgi:hypothetical protein